MKKTIETTDDVRELVKSERKELKWSMDKLAAESGVSKGAISLFLAGKRDVGTESQFKLLAALGVRLLISRCV